ncbi:translation initiation factor IF3-1, mitochondrial-like [Henckelia pumila]|uniref:translation initiation factor IF3-1, mitochondrial-like n=1 Tax=Henckelia pumila TaxID=405737 RepID=UPI003C6DD000
MSMAFWTTAKQSKPKFHLLQKELKRCYTLNQAPSGIVNRRISSRTLIPGLNSPDFIFRNSQLELFYSVRFFAVPAQANQKKEEVTSGPRLNEQITSQFIRLVSGEDQKVISRFDALGLAKNLKLDLVGVDRLAKPPVCKIFDFNKEKYLRQMKDKERAKSKTELKRGAFKEVRFAAKICTAIEPTGDVDLETLLSRFSALIKDVECEPKVEKKQAFVVVRHIKFGPKKGSGKKPTQASESTRNSSSKYIVALRRLQDLLWKKMGIWRKLAWKLGRYQILKNCWIKMLRPTNLNGLFFMMLKMSTQFLILRMNLMTCPETISQKLQHQPLLQVLALDL